jgi:hypothetical protein
VDEFFEKISRDGVDLAYLIRSGYSPSSTVFLTPHEFKQQVGFVVYKRNLKIPRHFHRAIDRHLVGTSEVIIVKSGRCLLDIYDTDGTLVATRELGPGDLMLAIAGGHGFRLLEDTVLLEIKQGPYTGMDEKEFF